MGIKIDDTFVKVSQTAGIDDDERTVEAEYHKQEKIENNGKYELRFLAAATNVKKEKVVEIVDQAMSEYLTSENLVFEKYVSKEGVNKPIVL